MQTEAHERAIRAKADLLAGIVLTLLGLYVFYEAYNMPRLEMRRIHPATIPGLVPMILGAGLSLLGAMLARRAWRMDAPDGWRGLAALFGTLVAARVMAGVLLVLLFTFGLIGWLPFWAASMIFIAAFILTFERLLTDAPVPAATSFFWAAVTAIVCGGGIYYLFSAVFLVRLP
ncbi:tripartite tricarboxylate transporter TctB family protein [Aliihoeflea sp. PC F10.4]